MSWTNENVDRLRKLWKDGLSCSRIAAQLGGGISRNAVIGKLQRLGLGENSAKKKSTPAHSARNADAFHQQRTAPRETLGRQLPIKERATPPVLAPIPSPIAEPPAGGVTLLELKRHHCRWPLWGDERPEEPRYCGAAGADMAADPAHPYCDFHSARSRGRGTPSERRAARDAAKVI